MAKKTKTPLKPTSIEERFYNWLKNHTNIDRLVHPTVGTIENVVKEFILHPDGMGDDPRSWDEKDLIKISEDLKEIKEAYCRGEQI